MDPFLVGSLIAVALLIGTGLHRVWAGPTVFDRLVAVALVTANGVVILVLLGAVLERPNLFFDIGISYALLAFLLPLALGRYFEQQIRERDAEHGPAGATSAQQPDTATGGASAQQPDTATGATSAPQQDTDPGATSPGEVAP